jgi:hypothetical protein
MKGAPWLLAALLGVAESAGAQRPFGSPQVIAPGMRVRLAGPALGPSVIGDVVSSDARDLTLILDKGPRVVIPWSMIGSSQASDGVHYLRGAWRGTKIGLLAALPLAVILAKAEGDNYTEYSGLDVFMLTLFSAPIYGATAGVLLTAEDWIGQVRPVGAEPVSDTALISRLGIPLGTRLRVTLASGERREGQLTSAIADAFSTTGSASAAVPSSSVIALDVRAGSSRQRGAIRGAAVALAITAVGVATDPLPTIGENLVVAASNAVIGGVVGARFFPSRGWMRLIDKRPP